MKIVPQKITTVIVLIISGFTYAGPGGGPPPPQVPPPELPIDGSVITLLFAAVTFGLYKVYQMKLHKKTPV